MLIAIAIAITSAIVCDLLLMLEAAKKERAHILVQQRWQGQSVPEHRSRRKKKLPSKEAKKGKCGNRTQTLHTQNYCSTTELLDSRVS